MSKWSGRGIPPTRRKLHRMRAQMVRERREDAREARAEDSRREFTWSKLTRKTIVNPARFEELWT